MLLHVSITSISKLKIKLIKKKPYHSGLGSPGRKKHELIGLYCSNRLQCGSNSSSLYTSFYIFEKRKQFTLREDVSQLVQRSHYKMHLVNPALGITSMLYVAVQCFRCGGIVFAPAAVHAYQVDIKKCLHCLFKQFQSLTTVNKSQTDCQQVNF